jgi:hypothetical protein
VHSKVITVLEKIRAEGGFESVEFHPELELYVAILVEPKRKRVFRGVDSDENQALIKATQDYSYPRL